MYHIINELLRPYVLVLVTMSGGAISAWRWRSSRWPLRISGAALICLVLMSTPAISYLAFATLESQTAPLAQLPANTEAIVVLSGALLPPTSKQLDALPATDTLYRCLAAAELYRRQRCLVLASGGTVDPDDGAPPLAQVMYTTLVGLGVASDDIVVEDKSTSTYENAVESKRILERLERRRIVLVTDASHMPRAAACFRHVGVEVIESPCRFVTGEFRCCISSLVPSPDAAQGIERVAHEWLGLAWYWLNGRI